MKQTSQLTRRLLLARLAGAAIVGASGWRAVSATSRPRAPTPSQGEGPFYPLSKPQPASNDLINGAGGAAEGRALALSGRVLTTDGSPLAGARVEIWQADHRGIYRHPRAPRSASADPGFAGYGESVTDASGRYAFLTIVPVPYTGRPPHIHVKVWMDERELLTTQLYLKDHPRNNRDGLLAMLGFGAREALMIELSPSVLDSGRRASAATFDLVV